MLNNISSKSKLKTALKLLFCLMLYGSCAYAVDDLASMSVRLIKQIKALSPVLNIVSYIAGMGYCLSGIVHFKAHRDNPTQVVISKPIVYLLVGSSLLFLPVIMASSAKTLFGSDSNSSAGKSNSMTKFHFE